MATKAQLEQKVRDLEEESRKYKGLLDKSENRYNDLVSKLDGQFEDSPTYRQMAKEIEKLELLNESHKKSKEHWQKSEKALRSKIQELMEDNERLKDSAKNQTAINDTAPRNPRNAGRHPKPKEKINQQLTQMTDLLKEGKKEKEICEIMNVSRSTFYRLKKLTTENG